MRTASSTATTAIGQPGSGSAPPQPLPSGPGDEPDAPAATSRGDAIVVENASKSFDNGRTFAVENVSLHVPSGQTLALLGSSGSGKTTLLKAINRLVEIDSGRIQLGETDIATLDKVELRRRIGYVFQGIGLFPHRRVRHNVETVPRLLGWPRAKRRERACELLDLVGLPAAQFADRFPDELSGGQRQRVGVARALAADPDIVLMDEPFGALDAVVRERLQEEVRRIGRELRKTIIVVTHDLLEALAIADRIAVLHDGRVDQCATPQELLDSPATEFVRQLIETPRRLIDRMHGQLDRPAPSDPTADDGDANGREFTLRGSRVVHPSERAGSRSSGEVA